MFLRSARWQQAHTTHNTSATNRKRLLAEITDAHKRTTSAAAWQYVPAAAAAIAQLSSPVSRTLTRMTCRTDDDDDDDGTRTDGLERVCIGRVLCVTWRAHTQTHAQAHIRWDSNIRALNQRLEWRLVNQLQSRCESRLRRRRRCCR